MLRAGVLLKKKLSPFVENYVSTLNAELICHSSKLSNGLNGSKQASDQKNMASATWFFIFGCLGWPRSFAPGIGLGNYLPLSSPDGYLQGRTDFVVAVRFVICMGCCVFLIGWPAWMGWLGASIVLAAIYIGMVRKAWFLQKYPQFCGTDIRSKAFLLPMCIRAS